MNIYTFQCHDSTLLLILIHLQLHTSMFIGVKRLK